MKSKRMHKLYEQLDGPERARLALQYIGKDDLAEFERLHRSTPWHAYRCMDLSYQEWKNAYFFAAFLWALQHWQLRHRLLAASFKVCAHLQHQQYDELDSCLDDVRVWEAGLLALDAALERFCAEQQLDPTAVRGIAETEPYQPIQPDVVPDAEYQVSVYESLTALVAGLDQEDSTLRQS